MTTHIAKEIHSLSKFREKNISEEASNIQNHPRNGNVPCNLETSRSLQTARWACSLQTACHAVCRLRGHRFNGSFYNFLNRENCHDFIVLYCVRNWEGISVVENLVRHNNRSFRANKLVIVSPNYKQENE